jgi:hypothetical protein
MFVACLAQHRVTHSSSCFSCWMFLFSRWVEFVDVLFSLFFFLIASGSSRCGVNNKSHSYSHIFVFRHTKATSNLYYLVFRSRGPQVWKLLIRRACKKRYTSLIKRRATAKLCTFRVKALTNNKLIPPTKLSTNSCQLQEPRPNSSSIQSAQSRSSSPGSARNCK